MSPRREAGAAETVVCVTGCGSRAQAIRALDSIGGQTRVPPAGWGEVDVVLEGGTVATVFVCSRACERRLASGLAAPTIGEL